MDKTINWYEKDTHDDVLCYLYEELEEKDQYPYFRYLMEKFPDLDIDWMEFMNEFTPVLIREEKIEDILYFVEWYERKFPEDYQECYGYIESELCDYFLFKKDKKSLLNRMSIIQRNPAAGIDIITIPLLYQLIYYGYYETAVSYSRDVWKVINEDQELKEFSTIPFINTIYISNLQNCYEAWVAGEPYDEEAMFKEVVAFGFDDEPEVFARVIHYLKTEPDIPAIQESIKNGSNEHMLALNIQFLKYMYHKHQFPFILSQLFWSFISADNLFGMKGSCENWFYIDVNMLDGYITRRLNLFYSNEIETFGKVWGLNYVFEFFHHYKLLSEKAYDEMRENIAYIKNQMISNEAGILWKMMFVFNWPDADDYVLDPSEKRLFESTFSMDDNEVGNKVTRYVQFYQIPERISKELELFKKKKTSPFYFPSPVEPINTQPKIGRNDPCICGSGKKYKKCCGDNE